MQLVNIGFGNIVSAERIVAIVSPESAPIKRLIQEAKDNKTAVDATYGTRHRAAIGISKESDAIVVVVSEETGKISIAKDGTLIADVSEDALKKILISNVVTKRFAVEKRERRNKIKEIREKLRKEKKQAEAKEEEEKKE